ncbi:MAG: type II secretion system F family protein [Cellvibrionaceae bacterium]
MTDFSFRARDKSGKLVLGDLEAVSKDNAAAQLMQKGLMPLEINEAVEKVDVLAPIMEKLFGKPGVPAEELIMFSRQMFTISKSGIPLIKGMQGLIDSITDGPLKSALKDVAERLEAGTALSTAMGEHPHIFNHLYVSLINVGENTGRLDQAFMQLALYMERDLDTVKRIKSAMRYPTFVLMAISAAMVIINIFVIPAFAGMFKKFGAELPLPTKILLGTSDIFVNYWPHMLAVLVAVGVALFRFMKTEQGQLTWGQKKLKMPIVGDIINRASMARYARTFALMLKAGVPLPQSLHLCSRAIDNLYLGEKIEAIRSGIERGESLTRTHVASGMFTPLVLQMISVGEESGQVDELLSEVAEFYEREVDYDLKTVADRIEPILLVIMAGFVLILALGIFLPMWDMATVQMGGK